MSTVWSSLVSGCAASLGSGTLLLTKGDVAHGGCRGWNEPERAAAQRYERVW
ncbi:unnamed protein product [Brassica rapa subsp. trilocularis]